MIDFPDPPERAVGGLYEFRVYFEIECKGGADSEWHRDRRTKKAATTAITKSIFTNLIRAMEGIHDLGEQINLFFGFNPGPKDRETILSRLFAVEDSVYEILGVDDKENGRVREIAGSDIDLEQKVELLMRLYPGKVISCSSAFS